MILSQYVFPEVNLCIIDKSLYLLLYSGYNYNSTLCYPINTVQETSKGLGISLVVESADTSYIGTNSPKSVY
jgi:hypothetical protein